MEGKIQPIRSTSTRHICSSLKSFCHLWTRWRHSSVQSWCQPGPSGTHSLCWTLFVHRHPRKDDLPFLFWSSTCIRVEQENHLFVGTDRNELEVRSYPDGDSLPSLAHFTQPVSTLLRFNSSILVGTRSLSFPPLYRLTRVLLFRDFRLLMINLTSDVREMKSFDGHEGPILSLSVHPQKKLLVRLPLSLSRSHWIRLWSDWSVRRVVMETFASSIWTTGNWSNSWRISFPNRTISSTSTTENGDDSDLFVDDLHRWCEPIGTRSISCCRSRWRIRFISTRSISGRRRRPTKMPRSIKWDFLSSLTLNYSALRSRSIKSSTRPAERCSFSVMPTDTCASSIDRTGMCCPGEDDFFSSTLERKSPFFSSLAVIRTSRRYVRSNGIPSLRRASSAPPSMFDSPSRPSKRFLWLTVGRIFSRQRRRISVETVGSAVGRRVDGRRFVVVDDEEEEEKDQFDRRRRRGRTRRRSDRRRGAQRGGGSGREAEERETPKRKFGDVRRIVVVALDGEVETGVARTLSSDVDVEIFGKSIFGLELGGDDLLLQRTDPNQIPRRVPSPFDHDWQQDEEIFVGRSLVQMCSLGLGRDERILLPLLLQLGHGDERIPFPPRQTRSNPTDQTHRRFSRSRHATETPSSVHLVGHPTTHPALPGPADRPLVLSKPTLSPPTFGTRHRQRALRLLFDHRSRRRSTIVGSLALDIEEQNHLDRVHLSSSLYEHGDFSVRVQVFGQWTMLLCGEVGSSDPLASNPNERISIRSRRQSQRRSSSLLLGCIGRRCSFVRRRRRRIISVPTGWSDWTICTGNFRFVSLNFVISRIQMSIHHRWSTSSRLPSRCSTSTPSRRHSKFVFFFSSSMISLLLFFRTNTWSWNCLSPIRRTKTSKTKNDNVWSRCSPLVDVDHPSLHSLFSHLSELVQSESRVPSVGDLSSDGPVGSPIGDEIRDEIGQIDVGPDDLRSIHRGELALPTQTEGERKGERDKRDRMDGPASEISGTRRCSSLLRLDNDDEIEGRAKQSEFVSKSLQKKGLFSSLSSRSTTLISPLSTI